jgi:hypothetical protein
VLGQSKDVHFLKRPESEEKMYDEMNMVGDEDAEDDEEHIIEALEKKMVVSEQVNDKVVPVVQEETVSKPENEVLDSILDELIAGE